jgi:hypothetical protein
VLSAKACELGIQDLGKPSATPKAGPSCERLVIIKKRLLERSAVAFARAHQVTA